MNGNIKNVFIVTTAIIMAGENGLHFLSNYDANEVAKYKQSPTIIQSSDTNKCHIGNKNIKCSYASSTKPSQGSISALISR